MNSKRVISTYLDNDDALNLRFVEDLQYRVQAVNDGTFIRYSDGYQFYTDKNYLLGIHYPKNHFVSVVESGVPGIIKGIFGYGGHYHIDELVGANIINISNSPMWCEVIHEKNMINDAYFIRTKMIRDSKFLKENFAVNQTIKYGINIYVFHFFPRYIKTFVRRIKNHIFNKND